MTPAPLLPIVRHCNRLARSRDLADRTDSQLLEGFLRRRDEEAFEGIVRRHGPMVWGVCRRVLRDEQDAEDAFQATFLVLARKAASVRRGERLAGWLYRVAFRAACAARAARARSREHPMENVPDRAILVTETWCDLRPVLDEELDGLPEIYRLPILLCDVQGRPRKAAARELKIPEGTLSSRLATGRRRLAARLAERGVTPAAVPALLVREVAACVPGALVTSTVKSVALAAPGLVSAQVASLAEGVMKGILMTKLKIVSALAVFVAASAGLMAHWAVLAQRADGNQAEVAGSVKGAGGDREARADRHGDPLPARAVARLGTGRFRHGAPVSSVAFSSDGKTLVATDSDRNMCLWDAATGKPLWRRRDVEEFYRGAHFLPDQKTLAVNDGVHLKLLGPATGKPLRRIDAPEGSTHCAFAPDGRTVATAAWKGEVLVILDVPTGKERFRFAVNRLLNVTYSPDGKTLAGVEADGTVRLWDARTGKELLKMAAAVTDRDDLCLSLVYSPDGRTLALGEGKCIRLWDSASGRELKQFLGHRADVTSVAFAPNGKTLASASRDNTVRLWEVATGKATRAIAAHLGWVQTVAFSPDGKTVASGSSDHTIRLWDVATGKEVRPRDGQQSRPTALALSPDGKTVATGGFHDGIRLWDLATAKELRRLNHPEGVMALAYSPDGSALVSTGWEGSVRLWNLAAGSGVRGRNDPEAKEVRRFTGHKDGVCTVVFSPDGKSLVTGGDDRTVRLWEVSTGKEVRCLRGHEHNVRAVALSPDGKTLASGSLDCSVRLWDAAAGRELRRLGSAGMTFPIKVINAVQFSPDGKTLAAAGRHDPVRLWEVASGKEVRTFEREHTNNPRMRSAIVVGGVADTTDHGPSRSVGGLAFSPDGRTLATAEDDHTVYVWEVSTGKPRLALAGHHGPVRSVAFAPDGKLLVSLSDDLTALVWDARPTPRQPAGKAGVTPGELTKLWDALAEADAAAAYRGMGALIASPTRAVPFLRKSLAVAVAADDPEVGKLIADLDADEREVRQRALGELRKLGVSAEMPLRRAAAAALGAEGKKQVERLLGAVEGSATSGGWVQTLRAVEALEATDTPEARQLLKALAKGAANALLTREAKAALERGTRPTSK